MNAENRPRLNREWHLANKMPPHPTLEQRLAWHEEHAKHCACREMPDWIREATERRRAAAADNETLLPGAGRTLPGSTPRPSS